MTPQQMSSKVRLVASPRVATAGPATIPIRRYRIAQLRLDSRVAGAQAAFEHLKRSYD